MAMWGVARGARKGMADMELENTEIFGSEGVSARASELRKSYKAYGNALETRPVVLTTRDLRTALGSDSPLKSPSKGFCVRYVAHIEGWDADETLEFKENHTASEAREVFRDVIESDKTTDDSIGPYVYRAMAVLEAHEETDIGGLAEENSPSDGYESAATKAEKEIF